MLHVREMLVVVGIKAGEEDEGTGQHRDGAAGRLRQH